MPNNKIQNNPDVSFFQELLQDQQECNNIRLCLYKILETLREQFEIMREEHFKETKRLQEIIDKKDEEIRELKSKNFSKKPQVTSTPLKILLKNPSSTTNNQKGQKHLLSSANYRPQDPFSHVNLSAGQNPRYSLQLGSSSQRIRLSSSKIKDRVLKNQQGAQTPITPRPFFNQNIAQVSEEEPRKSEPRNRVISLKPQKMKTEIATKKSTPCFFSSLAAEQEQFRTHYVGQKEKDKQNMKQFSLQKKTKLFKKPSKKNLIEQVEKKRVNSMQSSGSQKKNQIVVPIKIINVSDIKLR